MTDAQLVEACKKGDSRAQQELFNKFAGKMMALCTRYAHHKDDAQDILQEGFIKVFDKLEQYKGEGALGGWIRMIMINTALIHLRKDKNWHMREELTEAAEYNQHEFGVLEELAAEDLMNLIQDLPPGYKMVFNLFAIEGFSHKEIAEELSISESTSKTQFHKAKAWLQKKLTSITHT
jgi:RNA polymerase sigma factor (sigma-70 family)